MKSHQRIRALLAIAALTCAACPTSEESGETAMPPSIDAETARTLAWSAYVDARELQVLANEGARTPTLTELPAEMGDTPRQMWQVEVVTIDGQLRATVWVDPRSGDVQQVFHIP